ncbi:hypothetical protein N8Z75_02085, partial [Crocinitomicaceae bacterium]|nr:hypothetical protein [Crocinitomicaceae bacterium]
KPKKCFLGDYFSNRDYERQFVPSLVLPTISTEYESDKRKINKWREFFLVIQCLELLDDKSVIHNKLHFLLPEIHTTESHFKILQEFSNLYSKKSGLFPKKPPKISLLTNNSTDEKADWIFADNIHFSSLYKPTLDIQSDEEVNSKFNFLNEGYDPKIISKRFLKYLGVNLDFKLDKLITKLYRDIEDKVYINYLMQNSNNYLSDKQKVINNNGYTAAQLNDVTSIDNYIVLNYPSLISSKIYYLKFLEFLKTNKDVPSVLLKENGEITTILKMWMNRKHEVEHYLSYVLNKYIFFPTKVKQLRKPKELISYILEEWVIDKSRVPGIDLTKVKISDDQNLEQIIGIGEVLDKEAILDLLRCKKKPITIDQFDSFNIVEILKNSTLKNEDSSEYFLFSRSNKWTNIKNLCVPKEDLDIPKHNVLHDDLMELAEFFSIPVIGKSDLAVRFEPEGPIESKDIHDFFDEKARFIAFYITPDEGFKEQQEKLIASVNNFKFFQVDKIESYYDNYDFFIPSEYYKDEQSIYYVEKWINNVYIKEFLDLEIINNTNINAEVIKYCHENSEEDIIKVLIPKNKKAKDILNIQSTEAKKKKFDEEIISFIAELEETEWENHIPELKRILELGNLGGDTMSDTMKQAYNLMAKLKLAKEKEILFDPSETDFNILESDKDKFFVHSARGSFAYIFPNELVKMHEDGYKMALDFGAKTSIKIYNTAKDVLDLNTNHLMFYQKEKSYEDLIEFCKNNNGENKRLLVIDPESANKRSKEIRKLLESDDEH